MGRWGREKGLSGDGGREQLRKDGLGGGGGGGGSGEEDDGRQWG